MASACFAAGRLSMLLALIEKDTLVSTTPLWLPMGIGMGALLVFGYRYWPGIWLGQFSVSVTTGIPFALAASVSTSSLAAILISVYLLCRYFDFPSALDSIKSVIIFMLISVLLGPALSATFGLLLLSVAGIVESQKLGVAWGVFWIGDAMGALLLGPFLLIWGQQLRPVIFKKRQIELVFFCLLFFLIIFLTGSKIIPNLFAQIIVYAIFPFILWAALRFYQHGAISVACIAAVVFTWQTAHGSGPFLRESAVASMLQLDGYLFLITLTGLFLAASFSEYEQAKIRIRESGKKFQNLFETMVQGVVYQDSTGRIISANPAALKILGRTRDEIVNQTSEGVNWGAIHEDGTEFPGSEHPSIIAIRTGKPVMNTVMGIFNPVQNDYVWININAMPQFRESGDTPAAVYTTFEDFSVRKKIEDVLRINTARYAKAQEMGHVGNWEFDILSGTFWGSEEARRMFGFNPQNDALAVEVVESCIPDRDRVHQALVDLIERDKPYDIEYEIYPDYGQDGIMIHSVAELVKNDSGTPVKIIGVIKDITAQRKSETALRHYKDQLSQLNAHLQNIIEQERISIAREIHDDLGQTLSALKMDLGWLSKRLLADQAQLATKIIAMKSIIDQSVKSVKRICSDLRPGILDDLGLVAAVSWYLDAFQQRSGIPCLLNIEPPEMQIEPETSTALYRILQEALTNVVRHANASHVAVSLTRIKETIVLEVADNGKGIGSTVSKNLSFGIIGMRERAYALNGEFTVSEQPAGGAIIRVEIPVDRQEARLS